MDDPGFAAATRLYARWLARYMELRPDGLRHKAEKMKGGRFAFLRATFYRWRWQFAAVDPRVQGAPEVLAAGDVHLENFATWRDAEGRLAWGLSDFDDAARIPFTSDLVRLAVSILLDHRDPEHHLRIAPADAIAAVLDGYRRGLSPAAGPFILEADHAALREAAEAGYAPLKDWAKINGSGSPKEPPASVRDLLVTSLPEGATTEGFRIVDDKGLGSLGRPRWFLLARWHGGPLAREAKAAAPSAWWLPDGGHPDPVAEHRQAALLDRRAPDPAFRVAKRPDGAWVVRRLSPEARKIELKDVEKASKALPDATKAERQAILLRAMGGEVANLHVGAGASPARLAAALDDLAADDPSWLAHAADRAAKAVEGDRGVFLEQPDVVEEMPPA